MAAKKQPRVIKSNPPISLHNLLIILGALGSIIAGQYSVFHGTTLIQILTGWQIVSGPVLPFLGALGILGGLIALYGMLKSESNIVVIGGLVGLLAPSFLAVSAVIGGLLMRIKTQKTVIAKLLTYPK
jgi:hypothetical protein